MVTSANSTSSVLFTWIYVLVTTLFVISLNVGRTQAQPQPEQMRVEESKETSATKKVPKSISDKASQGSAGDSKSNENSIIEPSDADIQAPVAPPPKTSIIAEESSPESSPASDTLIGKRAKIHSQPSSTKAEESPVNQDTSIHGATTNTKSDRFKCEARSWVLANAELGETTESVYVEGWTKLLQSIATCRQYIRDHMLEVSIQGHFDRFVFPPPIIKLFGSQENAQTARARSRATAVIQKLIDLGLEEILLRERLPMKTSTFRGVTVTFTPSPYASHQRKEEKPEEVTTTQITEPPVDQPKEEESIDSPLVASASETALDGPSERVVDTQLDSSDQIQKSRGDHLWWIDLNSTVSVDSFDLTNQAGGSSVGLGWANSVMYARILGRGLYTDNPLIRYGYALEGSLGYRYKWFSLGLMTRFSRQASGFSKPIGDQTLTVALESDQCFAHFKTIQLCFNERYAPYSFGYRDADLIRGVLTRIDTKEVNNSLFELGFSIRFLL